MSGASVAGPYFAFVVGVLPLLITVPVAGTLTFDAWREKRSHGPLPPGTARSSQGLEGERDSATGDDLILCQAHSDTRVHRLLGHSVTQRVWRSVPARRASDAGVLAEEAAWAANPLGVGVSSGGQLGLRPRRLIAFLQVGGRGSYLSNLLIRIFR